MKFFADNQEPRTATTDFLIQHGRELPDGLAAQMSVVMASSFVESIVDTGELLYARRADLPVEGKVLGAQLAAFRAANGFHRDPDNTNTRAIAIAHAMMRDAGVPAPLGTVYPDPDADPAAIKGFVVPATEAPAAE